MKVAKKNIFYCIRVILAVCVGTLSIAAFFGAFYPIKIFDLQLGALLQRVFIDFSVVALVLIGTILIGTFIFGRLYCSTLCPFGILQEFIGLLKYKVLKRKTVGKQRNLLWKYLIAIIVFGILAGGTAYFLRLAEPYTYFSSIFSFSVMGLVVLVIITAIVLFKDRFFCTNLCPVGALLGVVSKFSINKIYIAKDSCVTCGKCEMVCPAGCIDVGKKKVSNELCVKCLKCLNVCSGGGVKYGINRQKKEVKFDCKRRNLVLSVATLVAFASIAKLGTVINKMLSEKFSDVILPPGAGNEARFLNKCLNCNLCVQVCPTLIIKKADKSYDAVSIDYSKGFCEYGCNNCSSVCPTGALKKLSIAEKKNLRIAMIAPPTESFDEFIACVELCPKGALNVGEGGKPIFTPMKCIGCGACVAESGGYIKIYGASEQIALK